MNLMDVLLFQERRQLLKLLKGDVEGFNANSKREMVEMLYPKLMNKNELKSKFQKFSNEAKRIALSLCYDKKLFLSKEELRGYTPRLKESDYQEILNELISAGILFSYEANNFLVPKQIKKELVRQFKLTIEEDVLILPTLIDENNEIEIINDLFYFIDIVAEKSLPLTKMGMIHKKDYQQIMKGFSIKEQLPNDKWRFGYGRRFSQYPDRFSLIYDFCFDKGWIKEEAGKLILGQRVEELFELKLEEFMQDLIKYWLKAYKRPIPTIRLLYPLFLELLKEGEGLDENCLISAFSSFVEPYYFDQKADIIQKRFLQMLTYLNIVKKVEVEGICCYTLGPAKNYVYNTQSL